MHETATGTILIINAGRELGKIRGMQLDSENVPAMTMELGDSVEIFDEALRNG